MNVTAPFVPKRLFCLSGFTSGLGILSSSNNSGYKDTWRRRRKRQRVIPCYLHTFPLATPGAATFCLSGMQLMWPTKGSFVRSHWLAHLLLLLLLLRLLAAHRSEGGSQGRWFLLHVLINLEVSAQRGHFFGCYPLRRSFCAIQGDSWHKWAFLLTFTAEWTVC